VIGVLQYLFAVRGIPQHIRSDNGPEFVAKAVCRWLEKADVKTLFVAKGSPWENGYVESFNGIRSAFARLRYPEYLRRDTDQPSPAPTPVYN
jgi:transposase InsO family protein